MRSAFRLVMCVLLLNHSGAKLDRQVGDLTYLGFAVIRGEVLRHSHSLRPWIPIERTGASLVRDRNQARIEYAPYS